MNDLDVNFYFTRDYLKAALLVSLLSVWVLVGLFTYLNHYTRRPYFTIWTCGWLFYAAWLTLNFAPLPTSSGSWVLVFKQWSVGISAAFMMWGALRFREAKIRQRPFALFIAFLLVWSYFGVFYLEDLLQIQLPVFALIAVASWISAHAFWQSRKQQACKGNMLLMIGFLLWGAYMAAYPFLSLVEAYISTAFFLSAILQVFIAVSMIILVLEEARDANRNALEELMERKAAMEKLQVDAMAAAYRYRALFDEAGDAIIVADAKTNVILEMNFKAEQILGIKQREAVIGGVNLELHLKPAKASTTKSESQTWIDWITIQSALSFVHKNGTHTSVEVSYAEVMLENTPARQFILRDATPKARLEKQLRQAEKMSSLGQMVSSIAHELNNPLSVVKGYLDLVLARHELTPQTRKDLEKVVRESNRAAKLVRAFLTFARETPEEKRMLDINEVVERIVELRNFDFNKAGVNLVTELDPKLPMTFADGEQLQQIVIILINNALQALSSYEDAPGCVKISTILMGNNIEVAVEDNGPGVPVDSQSRLFEPFFTTKPAGVGTGLGLSIAHTIMAEHHGSIRYQKSSLGGAGFYFQVPVLKAAAAVIQASQQEDAKDEAVIEVRHTAEILVLDDEPSVAELLGEFLQALGYKPTVCSAPLKALELIERKNFDLIVTDFRMPIMDGRRFYEAVTRKRPELASKIIFLTGDVASEDTRDFLKNSGAPHLVKPFQLINVEQFVRQILTVAPQTLNHVH